MPENREYRAGWSHNGSPVKYHSDRLADEEAVRFYLRNVDASLKWIEIRAITPWYPSDFYVKENPVHEGTSE